MSAFITLRNGENYPEFYIGDKNVQNRYFQVTKIDLDGEELKWAMKLLFIEKLPKKSYIFVGDSARQIVINW